MNRPSNEVQKVIHVQIAEAVLVAQYYGALKHAASKATAKKKVYLMPLGGGVFNNPWKSIAEAMGKATNMLTTDEHKKLDIQVLTWKGSSEELRTMAKLLTDINKYSE